MSKILRRVAASLLVCSVLLSTSAVKADSPLTSTPIAEAYQDVELVRIASKKGLTKNILEALSDPDVPDDIRAAIINALGWSVEGQQHARAYLDYIAQSRNQPLSELTIDELTPQETFSLGYLLAMDDYFNLSFLGGETPLEQLDAVTFLQAAVLKDPANFSVALVHSLAQAQLLLDQPQRWCDIYQLVAAVDGDFVGDRQMRLQAVEQVMDYISLYQDYCPASTSH